MTGALLIAAAFSAATNSVQELQPVEVWGERPAPVAAGAVDSVWRGASAAFAAAAFGESGFAAK